MAKIIGGLFGVFLLWLIVIVPIFGLHHLTGNGQHVGYITATAEHGVFFTTKTVYVKTDTQSSQEDSYCVVDPVVFAQLEQAATSKEKVQVDFISYFSAGIKNCDGEGDIITRVEQLQ